VLSRGKGLETRGYPRLLARMVIERHERARFWIVNLLCWLVVAILFTVWWHFDYAVRGRPAPFPVWYSLTFYGLRSLLWALFTPLIFHLVDRFPLRGRLRLANFGTHLVFSIVAMFANFFIITAARYYRGQMSPEFFIFWSLSGFGSQTLVLLLHYWGILLVGVMRDYIKQREAAVQRESQLRAQLAESQLRALQGQMKPHFIHNALNAVAALVKAGKPDAAVDTLSHISGLLRTLSDAPGRNLVPLRDEEQFVTRLLAIEQTRFGEKLDAHVDIPEDCRGLLVPNLALQPLVENAIKHGIAKRTQPGRIFVRARRESGRLLLEVVNDGPGPASQPAGPVQGVGLSALVQRLERIYGGAATAEFDFNREQDASATLRLPLQPPSAPA
jgi:sensor histidine kinase YesM